MSQQLDLFSAFPIDQPNDRAVDIDGLRYVAEFLDTVEQESAIREVDSLPWRKDLRRRVQHYGYRYDYKARRVDHSMYLGPLPPFAVAIADKLMNQALLTQMPDQVIVNEYLPGQGISAHIDCEPCFGERIATVSLGWAYEMEFTHVETHASTSLILEKGSALVLMGDARHKWLHEIKARKADRGVPRERRVSVTFRTVVLAE